MQCYLTSTFPLLAQRKQRSSLGVTGADVSTLSPPISHTLSTLRWLSFKSTLIRCTPSQGAISCCCCCSCCSGCWLVGTPVEGVLREFKVPASGLVVNGCCCCWCCCCCFSCCRGREGVKKTIVGKQVEWLINWLINWLMYWLIDVIEWLTKKIQRITC